MKKDIIIVLGMFALVFLLAYIGWYNYLTAFYMCIGLIVTGLLVEWIFPKGYRNRKNS